MVPHKRQEKTFENVHGKSLYGKFDEVCMCVYGDGWKGIGVDLGDAKDLVNKQTDKINRPRGDHSVRRR